MALTAHALPEEAARCLEAGADLHLPKPVKKSVLFDVIRRLAAPHPTQPPDPDRA